jgi:hypothetical protein
MVESPYGVQLWLAAQTARDSGVGGCVLCCVRVPLQLCQDEPTAGI